MRAMGPLLALAAAATAQAFYLPPVTPKDYMYQEKVDMHVVKLTSAKRQLPFRYYTLPVCQPSKVVQDSENLGQILTGARVESSDYNVRAAGAPRDSAAARAPLPQMLMRHNEFCNVLCAKQWSAEEAAMVADFIDEEYLVHLMMDNLPAVVRLYNPKDPTDVLYERGFPLGFALGEGAERVHYLFNHLHFVVRYHNEEGQEGSRVVGLEVEPFSVAHTYVGEQWAEGTQLQTCNPAKAVDRNAAPMAVDGAGEVLFTYDVQWEESDTPWAQRWDVYLTATAGDADVHWFSIVNSVIVVLFLSGVIATVLIRALYRDISQFNEELTPEEQVEESGWKQLHGDVFRPPEGFFGPMFLSVFVGSGAQLVCTVLATLCLAVVGLLSPANRGALLTAIIVLYMFLGCVAGYTSARMYKTFRGTAWKRNTLLTAFSVPGVLFAVVLFLNTFVWSAGSSMAIPFTTLLSLLVLWFGVSTPLVFFGAYFGFRKDEMKQPCRTNQVARHIPEQVWYTLPLPSVLMGGMLPFGAVFVELFYIMSSIWQQHAYYVFGFLGLVFLIVIVTCAEIAIVMTYFQLCAEDYNWWWRAFLTPATSALYVFLYSIVYFVTHLDIDAGLPTLLYFSYMLVACWAFFLLTGSVGFLSTLWFNRTIYGAIKIE